MTILAARRPHNNHHSTPNEPDGNPPLLAIVEPVVRIFGQQALEHRIGVCEVQAAFGEGRGALGGVEGDRHFM